MRVITTLRNAWPEHVSITGSVKHALLGLLVFISASVRQLYRLVDKHPGIIILSPADPGSLGDEAMMIVAAERLRSIGYAKIAVIYHTRRNQRYPVGEHKSIVLSRFFSWGSWSDKCRFLWMSTSFESFVCLGADVLDGGYSVEGSVRRLELVRLVARAGMSTRVVGFSLNVALDIAVIQAIRALPPSVLFFPRDPLSLQRLRSFAGVPGELSADLAFLLQPRSTPASRAVTAWIEERRAVGQIPIGINANYLLVKDHHDDPYSAFLELIGFNVALIESLRAANPRYCFILIPHDYRGPWSDDRLAQLIHEKLANVTRDYVLTVANKLSAAEVKAICARLEFLVTGRMHLAIAALGMGIPAACFSYQGKVQGLFEHFGIGELALELPATLTAERSTEQVWTHIENRVAIKRCIQDRLNTVLFLASKNLAGLPSHPRRGKRQTTTF
ncbi:polysaccharide pyruvyl transferase family protein [Pelomicrobium sp. G1]|uniref:polysaccharide pyruvyl transferase family protein n=1 Tax=unclassified Pelomicrobium TaxID=2815318 RepID=UPI003F76DC20